MTLTDYLLNLSNLPKYLSRRVSLLFSILFFITVLVILLFLNRKTWFYGDDFSFFISRFTSFENGKISEALFAPHNDHLVAAHALTSVLLQKFFGLNHSIFILVTMIYHVATCIVLAVLLRGHRNSPLIIAITLSIVSLNGAGWENIFWSFQTCFISGLFWSLLHFFLVKKCLEAGSRKCRFFSALTAIIAIASASTALPLLFVSALLLLKQKRIKLFCLSVLPWVGLYAVWRFNYSENISQTVFGLNEIRIFPVAMAQLVTEVGSKIFLFEYFGSVIIVLVLVDSLLTRRIIKDDNVRFLAFAGICFAVLLGVSRTVYGVEGVQASRYLYVLILLWAPGIAAFISFGITCINRKRFVCAVAIWLTMASAVQLWDGWNYHVHIIAIEKNNLIAGAYLVAEGKGNPLGLPSPQFNPTANASDVLNLIKTGQLQTPKSVTEQYRLNAAVYIAIDITSEATINPDFASISKVPVISNSRLEIRADCWILEPYGPAQIRFELEKQEFAYIKTTQKYSSTVWLTHRSQAVQSRPRAFDLSPGVWSVIGNVQYGNYLTVSLNPDSQSKICIKKRASS